MKTRFPFAIFFPLLLLLSIQILFAQVKVDGKSSITHLKANLQVLASDEFEGREATTRGEKIASVFIASELAKYGVKPYGDNGTYFQNFDLLSAGYSIESKIALIDNSGSPIPDFLIGDDFIRSGRGYADSSFAKQSTGIVFAGYGLTQKEYNYDDYANIDVRGKTVLILPGEPLREKNNSAGIAPSMTPVSNEAKIKLAREKGAVGVLLILNERMKSFWDRMKDFGTQPSITFPVKELPVLVKEIPIFMAGEKFVEKIFSGEKYSYENINAMIKAKESPEPFELSKNIKFNIKPFANTVLSRNVI